MVLTTETQRFKVNDFSDLESIPDSQAVTYLVMRGLAAAVDSAISERFLLAVLGLRSVLPLRCRIQKLMDRGIIEPLPVPNFG